MTELILFLEFFSPPIRRFVEFQSVVRVAKRHLSLTDVRTFHRQVSKK
jgi:hypothetical protein